MAGSRLRPAVGAKPPRARYERVKTSVAYSAELERELCTRVAAGELLYVVLREDGMPTAQSVGRWVRERADFAAALAAAREACGRTRKGGGVFSYSEGVGEEIFERLCDGESLTTIGADPTMPCLSTIFYWRRRLAQFEDQVQLGMRIRAERLFDLGWEMAEEATPETAYVTHVRLTHLRWHGGLMAPRVVKLKAVEPEKPPAPPRTSLTRHFEAETDPETGKTQVVAYCPNPYTRQLEREDTPGWVQPGDENTYSMPGGRQSGQGHWKPAAGR